MGQEEPIIQVRYESWLAPTLNRVTQRGLIGSSSVGGMLRQNRMVTQIMPPLLSLGYTHI